MGNYIILRKDDDDLYTPVYEVSNKRKAYKLAEKMKKQEVEK